MPCTERELGYKTVRFNPFCLQPGQSISINATSGLGKSYFLSLLAGVADRDVLPESVRPQNGQLLSTQFVYVPQTPAVRRDLTIKQECLYVWKKAIHGVTEEEQVAWLGETAVTDRFETLAKLLLLDKRIHTRIADLSGGEQKRFGLLLRLPFCTTTILLDEPDTGLDADTARQVITNLRSSVFLNSHCEHHQPPAILMVTHNSLTKEWADSQSITAKEVAEQPAILLSFSEDPLVQLSPNVAESQDPQRSVFAQIKALRHTLKEWINQVCNWGWFDMRHHLHLLLKSRQDWLIFILAPAAIFFFLNISGHYESTALVKDFAKYAFFGVIANIWLELQLYARTAVENTQIIKEEFWWILGLRRGQQKHLKSYTCALCVGLLFRILVTSTIQALIGTAFCFSQPYFRTEYTEHLVPTVTIFFAAAVYGGIAGLALGASVAWIQSAPPKIMRWILKERRKPSLMWINLLVPLIMLIHIIFSSVYMHGEPAGWSDPGSKYCIAGNLLASVNPAVSLESVLDSNFQNISSEGHPIGIWLVCLLGCCAITYWMFLQVLQTPDIRRE